MENKLCNSSSLNLVNGTDADGAISVSKISWLLCLFAVVGLVGLVSNALVVITFFKSYTLDEPAYRLINALALVDLTSILTVVGVHSTSRMLAKTKAVCLWGLFMLTYAFHVQFITIILITCDRYVAVMHPLRYVVIVTNRKVNIGITLTWIIPIFLNAPIFIDNTYVEGKGCNYYEVEGDIKRSMSIILFFVSGITVAVVYARLMKIALKHLRQIHVEEGINTDQQNQPALTDFKMQLKLLKTFIIVFGLFAACYGPACFIDLLDITKVYAFKLGFVRQFSGFLAFVNPLLDVAIYAWRLKVFREELRKVIKCN